MSKNKNHITKEQTISSRSTGRLFNDESLAVDIKFMPKGFHDFKYVLVATCKITNFILAIPIESGTAQVIVEALINRVICSFGPPQTPDCR